MRVIGPQITHLRPDLWGDYVQNNIYSKTYLKRPLKNREKDHNDNGSLMMVESIAECYSAFFWPALSDNLYFRSF